MPSSIAAPLPPLLSRRLILVTGKGGTGKTSVAAGLALHAAAAGLRVQVIETGRDENVPRLLGGDPRPAGYAGRELRPGLRTMRMDPYEEVAGNVEHMLMYFRWAADKFGVYQPMQTYVGQFIKSFAEYPQRQRAATRNVQQVLDRMQTTAPTGR